jgi:hypothetical protein
MPNSKVTYLPGAKPQEPAGAARVVQVILTDLTQRGTGAEDDPIRRVQQIWGLDGTLLAEIDPVRPKPTEVMQ